MSFKQYDGLPGKVFVPENNQPKKHDCRDCFSCNFCSDERCDLCLKKCGLHCVATNKRGIIINADDFGLTQTTCDAIIHCAQEKKISSTSIMTKRDGDLLLRYIPKLKDKNISMGLHLDLDEYFTFDETGHYGIHSEDIRGDYRDIIRENEKAIMADIVLQIKALLDPGVRISHIDGHHSVHLFPEILSLCIEILPRYGIDKMRYIPQFYHSEEERKFTLRLLREHGISFPDTFYDLHEIMKGSEDYLNTEKSAEIMCHIDTADNFPGKTDQYKFLLNNQTGGERLKGFHQI